MAARELALYNPASYHTSPASILARATNTSSTAAIDAQLMRVENQITVVDLRGAMRRRVDRHRACYAAVLDRCYARVRRCASVGRQDCTFEVPNFLPGLPLYDLERCVRFVVSHLAKNGFKVHRVVAEDLLVPTANGHSLAVSWSTDEDDAYAAEMQMQQQEQQQMRQQQQQQQQGGRGRGLPSAASPWGQMHAPAISTSVAASGRAAAGGRAAANPRVATVGPGGRGWPQQQHQQLFQQPQQLSHPQHPLARQASPPRNGGIRSISEFRPSGRFVLG